MGEKRRAPRALAADSVIQMIVLPAASSLTAMFSGSREAGEGMRPAGKPPAAPRQVTPTLQVLRGMTVMPALPSGLAVAGLMRTIKLPSAPDTHTMPLPSICTS